MEIKHELSDEAIFEKRAQELKDDMDNCMRQNPQYPGNILCMESIYNYEMFTSSEIAQSVNNQ